MVNNTVERWCEELEIKSEKKPTNTSLGVIRIAYSVKHTRKIRRVLKKIWQLS